MNKQYVDNYSTFLYKLNEQKILNESQFNSTKWNNNKVLQLIKEHILKIVKNTGASITVPNEEYGPGKKVGGIIFDPRWEYKKRMIASTISGKMYLKLEPGRKLISDQENETFKNDIKKLVDTLNDNVSVSDFSKYGVEDIQFFINDIETSPEKVKDFPIYVVFKKIKQAPVTGRSNVLKKWTDEEIRDIIIKQNIFYNFEKQNPTVQENLLEILKQFYKIIDFDGDMYVLKSSYRNEDANIISLNWIKYFNECLKYLDTNPPIEDICADDNYKYPTHGEGEMGSTRKILQPLYDKEIIFAYADRIYINGFENVKTAFEIERSKYGSLVKHWIKDSRYVSASRINGAKDKLKKLWDGELDRIEIRWLYPGERDYLSSFSPSYIHYKVSPRGLMYYIKPTEESTAEKNKKDLERQQKKEYEELAYSEFERVVDAVKESEYSKSTMVTSLWWKDEQYKIEIVNDVSVVEVDVTTRAEEFKKFTDSLKPILGYSPGTKDSVIVIGKHRLYINYLESRPNWGNWAGWNPQEGWKLIKKIRN